MYKNCVILRITVIISLYSINHLVFVVNTQHIFCEIEHEFLNIIYTNSGVKGLTSE
jgi:hypothetical protein